jgi:hypothetical protein
MFATVFAGNYMLGFLQREIPLQYFVRGNFGKSGKIHLDPLSSFSRRRMVPFAQVFCLLLELFKAGIGG